MGGDAEGSAAEAAAERRRIVVVAVGATVEQRRDAPVVAVATEASGADKTTKKRSAGAEGGADGVDPRDGEERNKGAEKRARSLEEAPESSSKAAPSTEAAAAARSPEPKTMAPIRLFATTSDVEARNRLHRTSCSSPDRHWSRAQCWTLREMLGFDGGGGGGATQRSKSPIEWLVACNFLVDCGFLLDEVPELVSVPRCVFFYGSVDDSFDPWRDAAGPGRFEAVRLEPQSGLPVHPVANPQGRPIPYGVHHTKMFLVGFADGTVRVVVHTANLRRADIHKKAQGAYVQDFPLKQKQDGNDPSSCDFEDDLMGYLDTYQYNKTQRWISSGDSSVGARSEPETLTQLIRRYDFSSASAVLIPSTPGYHKVDNIMAHPGATGLRVGHLKLRDAVAKYAAVDPPVADAAFSPPPTTDTTRDGGDAVSRRRRLLRRPIVCQFSSMGSLTEKYLLELQRSMDAVTARAGALAEQQLRERRTSATTNKASDDGTSGAARHRPWNPYGKKSTGGSQKQQRGERSSGSAVGDDESSTLQLQLVFPTVEEIRTSVEGYRGGGSVPGELKNVSKKFLEKLYRKWSPSSQTKASTGPSASGGINPLWKGRNVPHIKTYYQFNADQGSMDWFVVTSHNMSRAAWGDIQNSRQFGERRLFVRHWELGVFVSPRTLGVDRLVPWCPLTASGARLGRLEGGGHGGGPAVATVPLPYKVVPDPYEPGDRPWAWKETYGIPDREGRFSVAG